MFASKTTTSSVSDLNSWAVICLQNGRYSEAISHLEQAVLLFRKTSGHPYTYEELMRGCSEGGPPSVMALPLIQPDKAQPEARRTTPEANIFDMFDQAFVYIPPSYPSSIAEDDYDLLQVEMPSYLTLSLLLYNSGLALHKRGMLQENSAKSLRIALEFYHRALTYLNYYDCKITSAEVLLLRMSLLNNIGHIVCSMHRKEDTLYCRRETYRLLATKSYLLLPILKEEYRFFGISLFLLPPGREFEYAPAA